MQEPASFWNKHFSTILLGLIIIFYSINGINYLRHQSITADEGSFMNYAIRFVKGQPARVSPLTDNSKMPITVLNLVPRAMQEVFTKGSAQKTDWGFSDTMQGRYITLGMSVITILLVFTWSKQLYGKWAGLFSAFLMSFCPNNLANAGLVTTDSYAVLFLLLSMYLLWKFCRIRTTTYFILFSCAVAASQLVKQSLFHLYVLTPLCMLVYFSFYKEKFRVGLFARRLLLFIAISFMIINLGYYFSGSFTRLGDYHFMSNLFQAVQQAFPSSLPVPLPKPFTDGLDMAKYYDQVGGGIYGQSSFGKPTILGQARTGGSFWYYYFVALLFKTPITYIVFFFASTWLLFRHSSLRRFIAREFFLLAPVIYFLILMSFFYKTQCGIRHIIFILPFIFIFSGSLLKNLHTRFSRGIVLVLCIFLVISILRYWGNYYPYTNELIGDKKMAYLKVGAANLEFQQGYYFAMNYMQAHQDVEWAPKTPKPGKFIISTQDYLDVWNRHEFEWIKKYKPIEHVAYNYLLIEVK